jgi:hypothetical protein
MVAGIKVVLSTTPLLLFAAGSAPAEFTYREETPLPAVSANVLARCLGVTPKVIYDLVT